MLHKFANTLSLFLCSGTSELTKRKKDHMKKYLYCNRDNTFLDISNELRGKWWHFKNFNIVKQAKRLLHIV